MKEKITIRRFVESDAEAVQNMIHRGLREINGKDYPPELMEEYCHYFTLEKIKSQADSAHTYVAVAADKVIGTGSIAPYWGSLTESILLTIYILPECIGKGAGTAIVKALEQDEYFLRADRIEIPSSVTAVKFYEKMGYFPKNGIEPDEEGIVPMEKFRAANPKPLSDMTLEELWKLFPIILTEHDPAWKNFYDAEKELLSRYFGDLISRINHIGSTAVEGLFAKPTVDILLEVAAGTSPATIRQIAIACGYAVMAETFEPEYRLDLCKGYTPQGFAEKVFHLHIRYCGDWDELIFCEYLKKHPDKAQEYAQLKIELQKRFKHNRDAYTEAKGDFIRQCVKEARQTAACQANRFGLHHLP